MRDFARNDPADPGTAYSWRFGVRCKMWAAFGAIALMVVGTTLVSWTNYHETNASMGRIVNRTLPLMARLSGLAQMSQKMLALTPAVLMAADIAGVECAAATFALAQLDGETALRPDLVSLHADAARIDADLTLLISAQRQRIQLAASFAAISDQVDVLHQEYRLLSDSGGAAQPKARQFLVLTNRFLVGLTEIGRIDALEDLDALEARLHPTLNTLRGLLDHPDLQPLRQGAERIVMRMDGIAFGEASLTALRGREIPALPRTGTAMAARRDNRPRRRSAPPPPAPRGAPPVPGSRRFRRNPPGSNTPRMESARCEPADIAAGRCRDRWFRPA